MLEDRLGAPKAEGICIGWLSRVLTPTTHSCVREMQLQSFQHWLLMLRPDVPHQIYVPL